jgi:hypothetical protein
MQINFRILHFFFIVTLVLNLISCESKIDKIPKEKKTKYKFPDHVDTTKFLKQTDVINYIKNAPPLTVNKQGAGSPFDTLNFNKVIAYDYEGNFGNYAEVKEFYSQFTKSIYKQKTLNKNQVNFVLSEFTNTKNYGDGTAKCFEPHMAIVFFQNNNAVNIIEICMDCNYFVSTIRIPNQFHSKVNTGTEYEYSDIGFTPQGKRMIKKLSKELGFSYGNISESDLKNHDEFTKIKK